MSFAKEPLWAQTSCKMITVYSRLILRYFITRSQHKSLTAHNCAGNWTRRCTKECMLQAVDWDVEFFWECIHDAVEITNFTFTSCFYKEIHRLLLRNLQKWVVGEANSIACKKTFQSPWNRCSVCEQWNDKPATFWLAVPLWLAVMSPETLKLTL